MTNCLPQLCSTRETAVQSDPLDTPGTGTPDTAYDDDDDTGREAGGLAALALKDQEDDDDSSGSGESRGSNRRLPNGNGTNQQNQRETTRFPHVISTSLRRLSDVVRRRSSSSQGDYSGEECEGGGKIDKDPPTRRRLRSKRRAITRPLEDVCMSIRRAPISQREVIRLSSHINQLEVATKGMDWLRSFRDLDPRIQILNFFNELSLEGVEQYESRGCCTKGMLLTPRLLRGFIKSGIFSVWRPTSLDAIRKMMTGEGTGKGLDIKGKSAKCGAFSGFVPYLQIHNNDHKSKVGIMRPSARVRVFYPNEASRDEAAAALNMLGHALINKAERASDVSERASGLSGKRGSTGRLRRCSSDGMISLRNLEDVTIVHEINDYVSTQGVYGLELPEKLFWEGYVVNNDITRAPGSKYETGRPSMPEFQQMNIETLRDWNEHPDSNNPRPVLWHGDCGRIGEAPPMNSNPLCPLGLLMAYEECNKVTPVVSDFDCFLLGTRGVKYYEPLGAQELSMLSMCVDDIEGILETPQEGASWTQRWLEVKKKHYDDKDSNEMPPFGYADPRSYKIMTGAVHRLKSNGAVRHGPECFNYGFPQDLDDYYLVISDTFPGVPWRYANSSELIDILCEKVDEGFTFPLNPKWVLCDEGWKKVYSKLLASRKPNCQESMNIWYPPEVRKRIDDISSKYPNGFVDPGKYASNQQLSGGVQVDLAALELRKYKVRVDAKRKFRHTMMLSQRRTSKGYLREEARRLSAMPSRRQTIEGLEWLTESILGEECDDDEW